MSTSLHVCFLVAHMLSSSKAELDKDRILMPGSNVENNFPYYLRWACKQIDACKAIPERKIPKKKWPQVVRYSEEPSINLYANYKVAFHLTADSTTWERGALKLKIKEPEKSTALKDCEIAVTVSTKLKTTAEEGSNRIEVESVAGFPSEELSGQEVRISIEGSDEEFIIASIEDHTADTRTNPTFTQWQNDGGAIVLNRKLSKSFEQGATVKRLRWNNRENKYGPYIVQYKYSERSNDLEYETRPPPYDRFVMKVGGSDLPSVIDVFLWPGKDPQVYMYVEETLRTLKGIDSFQSIGDVDDLDDNKRKEKEKKHPKWPSVLVSPESVGIWTRNDEFDKLVMQYGYSFAWPLRTLPALKGVDDDSSTEYHADYMSKFRLPSKGVPKIAFGFKTEEHQTQSGLELGAIADINKAMQKGKEIADEQERRASRNNQDRRPGAHIQTFSHLARRAPGVNASSFAADESRASYDSVSSWPKVFADRALQRRAEQRRLAKRKAFLAA